MWQIIILMNTRIGSIEVEWDEIPSNLRRTGYIPLVRSAQTRENKPTTATTIPKTLEKTSVKKKEKCKVIIITMAGERACARARVNLPAHENERGEMMRFWNSIERSARTRMCNAKIQYRSIKSIHLGHTPIARCSICTNNNIKNRVKYQFINNSIHNLYMIRTVSSLLADHQAVLATDPKS